MDIDWLEARRLMLTSGEAFSSPPWEKTVSTLEMTISPEQVGTAERCLRALYQGLQWASKYEIKFKQSVLPRPVHHFFLDDEHVIGIFRDCFRSQIRSYGDVRYPNNLSEYIELQTEGGSFMVADLVLEKGSRRLANRWSQNRQSKFLRDVIFPGLMGIVAHYRAVVEPLDGGGPPVGWAAAPPDPTVADGGGLLTPQLLRNALFDAQASDALLTARSPLVLFYDANSPFNLELPPVDPRIAPHGPIALSRYPCATAGQYFVADAMVSREYPSGPTAL